MSLGGALAATYSLLVLAAFCGVTYVRLGKPVGLVTMLAGVAGAMFHDLIHIG